MDNVWEIENNDWRGNQHPEEDYFTGIIGDYDFLWITFVPEYYLNWKEFYKER